MEFIELYRTIIPTSKIINDNHGQHYRVHMGNIEWLTDQFNRIFSGKEIAPGDFSIPNKEEVLSSIQNKKIYLRCEVWRCVNTVFDPQNYAKTFKAPIDMLVHNGYIKDDSWKYLEKVEYSGGGPESWNKALRYKNDGFENDLTKDWWNQQQYESLNKAMKEISPRARYIEPKTTDIMIRLILCYYD